MQTTLEQAARLTISGQCCFEELQKIGPAYGYFPEPTKSILVVPPAMVELAKEYFHDHEFKITTGSRYLGGFIGSRSSCEEYVKGKVFSCVFN